MRAAINIKNATYKTSILISTFDILKINTWVAKDSAV